MHKYDPVKFRTYINAWYSLSDKDSDYAFNLFWQAVCCAPTEFLETMHMLMIKSESERSAM